MTTTTLLTSETSALAARPPRITRRRFVQLASASVVAVGLYGSVVERHEIDLVRRTILLPNLPEAFAGFTIAQVSDIHLEEYTEPLFLKYVIDRVNALRPDLVVLTGDFVTERPLDPRYAVGFGYRCAELLSALTCPLRYAVMGNHDATVGAAAITDALQTHHLPVLTDASVPIERNGARLWLAGIRDALADEPNLDAALPRKPGKDEPVILLAHEPDFADNLAGRPVDLMLSGHTHGGQIRIPFMRPLILPDMGKKYIHGLFRLGRTQLYVNRGIGTVTVPYRFHCPPEVTLLRLERGQGQSSVFSS